VGLVGKSWEGGEVVVLRDEEVVERVDGAGVVGACA